MSQPKFKVGDKFIEEDKIINEILYVAPTVTDDGNYTYFLKVTSPDDPKWLKYDYTYEDYLDKYCEKIIVETEYEKLNKLFTEKFKNLSSEEISALFSKMIAEVSESINKDISEGKSILWNQ